LEGQSRIVLAAVFDLTGRYLAAIGGETSDVSLWDRSTGELVRSFDGAGYITAIAFKRTGNTLVSGSSDGTVIVWDHHSARRLATVKTAHLGGIRSIAVDPSLQILGIAGNRSVTLINLTGPERQVTVSSHSRPPVLVTFVKSGILAAAADRIIKIFDVVNRTPPLVLEGHTGEISALDASRDGSLLASKDALSLRLWDTTTGQCVLAIAEPGGAKGWLPGLAFHPSRPLLASVTSELIQPAGTSAPLRHDVIQIWTIDPDLLNQSARHTHHYVNAKVVMLGDSGVGKSGLSLVLNGQPFAATDSTAGRRIWVLESREARLEHNITQTQETLLWDFAGQPGYRIIHQLHLNEVAVALVVFDARSETDPLAGIKHWGRALHLALQRQGASAIPMTKILVSARNDRGTISVSRDRIDSLMNEFDFDAYFETSAKENRSIDELLNEIKASIPWPSLPIVASSLLFTEIKSFLLRVKEAGTLLDIDAHLYDRFASANSKYVESESSLRDQFDTCIGRLENRDLIRRLSFGHYVLLQPELLDAYASAMVNAAKEEPDGFGSINEEPALAGQFLIPKDQKVGDRGEEQLLLHATVEELVGHDLALRENAADGRYLVFPSQFNRDYEDAPEPKGKATAIIFEGPVQSLYSTLAVRLGHSGLFTVSRSDMWRNAAIFAAKSGGKCGLYLHEFAEARGRLVIFYQENPSDETRFNFEEFIESHVRRRAIDGSVVVVRFFVCSNCGDAVPDNYVQRLRVRSLLTFECPCGSSVSLAEPKERLQYASKIGFMERSADRQRDFEVFVQSARGETSTPSFVSWAGDDRVTLAVVFTDVVGSTALGEEIRDERMNEVRRAHFTQSRRLIAQFGGREIKTIGDSFMAAFRSVQKALDYALALQGEPGHPKLQIRAGIHIDSMSVEENDIFGGAVNFAARVVGAIEDAEIWVSERAKEDIDRAGTKHAQMKWEAHRNVQLKGFQGGFTLWSLCPPE